uniref:(California timema) hypothetical protein n=1 Tax=Timema californicum TaxID=61474 RepID=A0A7R9JDX4_TIMCA|nr:unnamed protein product [Timema californicum]
MNSWSLEGTHITKSIPADILCYTRAVIEHTTSPQRALGTSNQPASILTHRVANLCATIPETKRSETNLVGVRTKDHAAKKSQIGASYLETDLSTESSTGIITVETWSTSKDYGVRERGFVGVRYVLIRPIQSDTVATDPVT